MATNWTYFTQNFNGIKFHVIKTKATNIRNRIIKGTVVDSGYYGINGGFFSPYTNGLSIAYCSSDSVNCTANTKYKRGTLFIYDNGTKVATEPAFKVSELSKTGVTNAFGGITLQLGLSESTWISNYSAAENFANFGNVTTTVTDRTGMGYKIENGTYYVYLVTTDSNTPTTIANLRNFLQDGLALGNAIMLDGGGSTQMNLGSTYSNRGSDGGNGRLVYNMVTLISKS